MIFVPLFFLTKKVSYNPCSFVEKTREFWVEIFRGAWTTQAVRSEQMGGLYSVAFSKTVRVGGENPRTWKCLGG